MTWGGRLNSNELENTKREDWDYRRHERGGFMAYCGVFHASVDYSQEMVVIPQENFQFPH